MAEALQVLSNLFTLGFVLSSMGGMGASLTVPEIVAPLRNGRLVGMALVANFLVVPAVAYGLAHLIPLAMPLQIGLILFGTAAGAPFLPKLAQIAKADIAFAVGLMVLLLVATIVYLPLVLPLLLPGVQVASGQIAGLLVLTMLLPLAVGLAVRARYPETAASAQPVLGQVSNISLVLLLVLTVALNFSSLLGLLGSGAILAILVVVVVALAAGYLLGGPDGGSRSVLGLGTGQRNLAAAMIIATSNFTDPTVLVTVAAAGTLGMLVLFPAAGELGRRARAGDQPSTAPVATGRPVNST